MRGGGSLFGGGAIVVMAFVVSGVELWVGEVVLSRFMGDGSNFGESDRFLGDLASVSDGSCFVVAGSSWIVGFPNGSSFTGASSLAGVSSSFSNGGRGSGRGIIGIGKSL